jgi:DNA helicase HerA-like ATPase
VHKIQVVGEVDRIAYGAETKSVRSSAVRTLPLVFVAVGVVVFVQLIVGDTVMAFFEVILLVP